MQLFEQEISSGTLVTDCTNQRNSFHAQQQLGDTCSFALLVGALSYCCTCHVLQVSLTISSVVPQHAATSATTTTQRLRLKQRCLPAS